jgi:hypothetical protein
MKNITRALLLASIAPALFAAGAAQAAGISDDSYKAQKDSIEAQYDVDKKNCEQMSGNQKDVCVAQIKGKEKVAKARLEAEKSPTPKTQQDYAVAKAEADYDVAKAQCGAQQGNAKDTCEKAAKDAYKAAESTAKMRMGSENQ